MVKRTEYNFLKPYGKIIGIKLKVYKESGPRGCLGVLAKKSLHIDQSRLSAFIALTTDAPPTIELTPTYIYAFLKGGFITVDEILRGKDLLKMSSAEQEFWNDARCLEDRELMTICKTDPVLIDIIKRIKRKGKDPKSVLLAAFLSEEG